MSRKKLSKSRISTKEEKYFKKIRGKCTKIRILKVITEEIIGEIVKKNEQTILKFVTIRL